MKFRQRDNDKEI